MADHGVFCPRFSPRVKCDTEHVGCQVKCSHHEHATCFVNDCTELHYNGEKVPADVCSGVYVHEHTDEVLVECLNLPLPGEWKM